MSTQPNLRFWQPEQTSMTLPLRVPTPRGLTAMILDKIHAQPLLSKDLKAWKESACQIDQNHRCLLEVKQGQVPLATTHFTAAWTNIIPFPTNPVVTKLLSFKNAIELDNQQNNLTL